MRVTALLLCLLLLLPAAALARTFVPVGSANGLDARVAVSLLVDSKGYLWVGSREGLFRIDGPALRAYLPDASDPGTITDTDIRFVYEAWPLRVHRLKPCGTITVERASA